MNKVLMTFSQLLKNSPPERSFSKIPEKFIDFKGCLAYFSRAASTVARENIRFHRINAEQAPRYFPELMALEGPSCFSLEEWNAVLSANKSLLIVAFNSIRPIGFILGHQDNALEDAYIVDDIALSNEYQRRGIGSWLVKALGCCVAMMSMTQLVGYTEGKTRIPSWFQEYLRWLGAEEIGCGLDGEHYLRLDLSASCVVPSKLRHMVQLGQCTSRMNANIIEAEDASWHRRIKTFRTPPDLSDEDKDLGEDSGIQSKWVASPKSLAQLLQGLDFRDVEKILPGQKKLSPAVMKTWPHLAAAFDGPFSARPEIIPFIRETALYRSIQESFGEVAIEAVGDKYILSHGQTQVGEIWAGPEKGLFSLTYHGKLHPQGIDQNLRALGCMRIDSCQIDLGDLYFLLNICHHYQLLEACLGKQVPLLTNEFYTSLRGTNTARALLTILFVLNHVQDAQHLNNFIHAMAEAATTEEGFFAFWSMVETLLVKNAGWDRINLACGYITKAGDIDYPLRRKVGQWGGENTVLHNIIYEDSYLSINMAILTMVVAGAKEEDIDKLFEIAMTAQGAAPAFQLFLSAGHLFSKGGAGFFADLLACLQESPLFEIYSSDIATKQIRQIRFLLSNAAADLVVAGGKEAVLALFNAYEIDSEFGFLLAKTVKSSLAAAQLFIFLLPEIKLCKDRRIREKLRQVILTAQGWLDGGEGEKIFELMKELRPANAYDKLDQLYYLLQFSSDVIEARILIAGGMSQLQEHLFGKMLKRFGVSRPHTNWSMYSPESFVRSVSQLLRQKQAVDPNIGLLLGKVSQHGSIQQFYRADENAQRTIRILQAQGYNIEQLVFGKQVLMQSQGKSGTTNDLYSSWFEIAQVVQLLFGKEFGADFLKSIEIMKDPEKAKVATFNQIELLRKKLDEVAGTSQRTTRRKEELKDLLNGVEWQARHSIYIEGGRIESRKSIKAVPEFLFDSRRLACCIFMPNGDLRNEIPLVAMDPQTPAIEFWLSEMSEFAGIAIEYAGKNRELLLDTFEFNQSLTAALGGDPTFRFVTDSLILDAHLSNVKNLLVFDCNYGHPLRYVRYVRKISGQEAYKGIVRFEEKYPFELADLENQALRHSKSGVSMHYTDAFRTRNFRRGRMKGRIPVFVIDVEAYFQKFKERIDSGKVII